MKFPIKDFFSKCDQIRKGGEILSISGKWGEPYFMGGLDNRLAAMLYCFTLISLWVAIITLPVT